MGDERGRQQLLGMAQRFGPYSFVVNTDKVSRATAEDQGWDLWNDAANAGSTASSNPTTGTSSTSACIAGFDPFKEHTEDEVAKFTEAAKRVFKGAKLVGDIATMNQSLVSGEIDFHMTGGTYSASPARADGNTNIRGITPKSGPMRRQGRHLLDRDDLDGQQSGICRRWPSSSWSMCRIPRSRTSWPSPRAPSTRWRRWATKECFDLFTTEELDAIQWDSLEEEMSGSVEYDIVPDYDKLARHDDARRSGLAADVAAIEPPLPGTAAFLPDRCLQRSSASAEDLTKSFGTSTPSTASTSRCARASSSPSSGPRARARPRCSACWPAWRRRATATSCCAASASTMCRPTGGRPAWCSSRWRCFRTARSARTSSSR